MSQSPSARIREELRRKILSGRLAPGARLPTERQLAVRYGASATTVNKVMAGLELEGLLDRRRGTGTYVRPDLGRRSLALVLGPPHEPPGPRFWSDLARLALDAAARSPGGVRTYLDAGTTPSTETALALDAAAGRISGALFLGAGVAATAMLQAADIPLVHLVAPGEGPAVRVAWREAARELVDRLRGRGAWPVAVQLPPGWPGDEIEAGCREAVAAAGSGVDDAFLGRAAEADGPQGGPWVRRMAARGARGLILAGVRPEAALAAAGAMGGGAGALAVVVWTVAGDAPALDPAAARVEIDLQEIVQAGFEVVAALRRGEGGAAAPLRVIRPRFIEGAAPPR